MKHTKVLSSWMRIAGVQNELVMVKDARHYGVMFDADDIRKKVIDFPKK